MEIAVRIWLALSSVLLAWAACLAVVSEAGPINQAGPVNHYVDSQACAQCHRQIYESYKQTSMGRSFFRPMTSNTIEDYKQNNTYHHALSDTYYSMVFHDGGYYQRRWQIGFQGVKTNAEELSIDYVLGSGDHARSYLHRTSRGSLIELPLGWYSERGGYWAMSPGFDSPHPQTRRFISYQCMFCHNAYPGIPVDQAGNSDPVFVGDLPQGIDCQRCHGPGGQHVRIARSAGASITEISDSIVNPARLSPQRQMEVCMQCHLEPTSGAIPSYIRRFNRGPFSYIPGQPLQDFMLYFDYPPKTKFDSRFELESAAYRLRKSRCFLESKGKLTCLTCHDPHQQVPSGEQGDRIYDSACRRCHEPALASLISTGKHPSEGNCVSCHMPKRRTDDVVHAVITDHFIQRTLPAQDLLAEIPERHRQYQGEIVPYYPSPLPDKDENALYRAAAQLILQNNLQSGLSDLVHEMAKKPPREMEFYVLLGDAWRDSDRPSEAAAAFREAVRREPTSLTALQSLAGALRVERKTSLSEETLKRALQIAPSDGNVWFQYGMLESQLGRTDRAIEDLQKAVALNPDLPEGDLSLASLLARKGQIDSAESALHSALSIDPYDAAAYDLSGQLLADKEELPEALYNFEKANRLRPRYAPYLYDYALGLLRANRPEEALAQAQAATSVDPSFAEAHELSGGLLARAGKLGEAATQYRQALKSEPGVSRVELKLGMVLVAEGDLAGATEHLQKAAQASDPLVARQATLALQRIGKY